jgi:hypothetical protein
MHVNHDPTSKPWLKVCHMIMETLQGLDLCIILQWFVGEKWNSNQVVARKLEEHTNKVSYQHYINITCWQNKQKRCISKGSYILPMPLLGVLGEIVNRTSIKEPNKGFGWQSWILFIHFKLHFLLIFNQHVNSHETSWWKLDCMGVTLSEPTWRKSLDCGRF